MPTNVYLRVPSGSVETRQTERRLGTSLFHVHSSYIGEYICTTLHMYCVIHQKEIYVLLLQDCFIYLRLTYL